MGRAKTRVGQANRAAMLEKGSDSAIAAVKAARGFYVDR
jgi:hypothetical protein